MKFNPPICVQTFLTQLQHQQDQRNHRLRFASEQIRQWKSEDRANGIIWESDR